MITDSHCHLASSKFNPDELTELLQRARDQGVHRSITLATSLHDLQANLDIAQQHASVYACLGIHPCDVMETPDTYLTELSSLLKHPKCVAIGETGLDYYHPAPEGSTESEYRERQRNFLHQHFQLAREHGKNIVIHTRDKTGTDSLKDALAIYQEYHKEVKAVFHCFLGPWQNALPILELGGLVSFTGISTFKSAKDCHDAVIQAPAGKFMLETDAPYLAPVPHRGKCNEPGYTSHIAQHIANVRSETLQELAKHTEATVEEFFQIPTSP